MSATGYFVAVLLGICLCSTVQTGLLWRRVNSQESSGTPLAWLTLVAMLACICIVAELIARHAPSPMAYLEMMQLRAAFGLLLLTSLLWFVHTYSAFGVRRWLQVLTASILLLALAYAVLPVGTVLGEPASVRSQTAFLGGPLYFHRSHWNPVALSGWFVLLVFGAYSLFASRHAANNDEAQRHLALLITPLLAGLIHFPVAPLVSTLLVEGVIAPLTIVVLLILLGLVQRHYFTLCQRPLSQIEQGEEKYRVLFESSGDAILLIQEGVFIDCNQQCLELFSTQRSSFIGASVKDFSAPIQLDGAQTERAAQQRIDMALDGISQYFEWQCRRQDGTDFTAEVRLNRVQFGGRYCIQATVRDTDERREGEHALRVISEVTGSQLGTDFFHGLTKTLCSLFGSRYAFIGVLDKQDPNFVHTLSAIDNGVILDNITYPLKGSPCETVVGREACYYREGIQQLFPDDGMLVDMGAQSYMGCPIYDSNDKPLGLVSVVDTRPMRDVSHLFPVISIYAARAATELERLEAEEKLYRLAYEDYLTALPNRAALLKYLLDTCTDQDSLPASLQLINLDNFKNINDGLSHEVGDEVLRLVAERLRQLTDERDFLAHLGADEFAIIAHFPDLGQESLKSRADSYVRAMIQELTAPLQLQQQSLSVGASCGVVLLSEPGDNQSDILRHADIALQKAKHQGHRSIQFFEAEMQQHIDARLQLEAGLRQALELQQLSVELQPIVTADGIARGAEALLRWQHPELGRITPDRFIPVAEETGLVHEIDCWVLEQVCDYIQDWQLNQGFTGYVSVNVSAWEFSNPAFVSQVIAILESRQIPPERVVLELTESAMLYDLDATVRKVAKLRQYGLRIAMDDFGTGYSSLAYLQKIHADILKMDRVFTNELLTDSRHPLVEAIAVLGSSMGMTMVAEGVEQSEQVEILSRLDCHLYQGYYYCKPLPLDGFCHWVAEQNKRVDRDNSGD